MHDFNNFLYFHVIFKHVQLLCFFYWHSVMPDKHILTWSYWPPFKRFYAFSVGFPLFFNWRLYFAIPYKSTGIFVPEVTVTVVGQNQSSRMYQGRFVSYLCFEFHNLIWTISHLAVMFSMEFMTCEQYEIATLILG